jgi:hypothetical protein
MELPFVRSGQVAPEPTDPVSDEIDAAARLWDSGLSPADIEWEWDQILDLLTIRSATDAQRAQVLTDAAGVRVRLYELHRDRGALERARGLLVEALGLAEAGSGAHRLASTYLGVTRGYQYDLDGDPQALADAVRWTTECLDEGAESDWRLAIYALNSGLQCIRVFQQSGQVESLDAAVAILTEAAKTKPGSAVHRRAVSVLPYAYAKRHELRQDPADLIEAERWRGVAEQSVRD